MVGHRWSALVALVAWTVLVWGNRVLNVVRGDETLPARVVSSITAVVFLALAAGAALVAVRTRRRPLDRQMAGILGAFAGLTIAYWPARMGLIALADHPVGFVVVHLVLGVVAVALSVPVLRAALAAWPRQALAR